MSGHGYGPYTRGCRCDVCRQAKADHMRAVRAAARAAARASTCPGGERPHVDGITHGRNGYETKGCRCTECTSARSQHRCDTRRRSIARRLDSVS